MKSLGEEAKHVVQDVASQARETAQVRLSSGKDRAAQGLDTVADALRHTGQHLRLQDQPVLPEYIDRVAEGVQAASGYLRERELSSLISDVENFARREPALFFGGAFALGLLGGRFLKSSRPSSQAPSSGGEFDAEGTDAEQARSSRSGRGRGRRQSAGSKARSGARSGSSQSIVASEASGPGEGSRAQGTGARENGAEAE